MSLEATLTSLRHELARLQEAVCALQVTVTEDKPARGAAVLVDQLDNQVMDLSGALEEADAHAVRALQGCRPNGPLDQARTALHEIHASLNQFTASYAGELAAHDHIAQLLQMGQERGREWREWSQVVKTAIERCARPMSSAASALLECWNELAGCLARNPVSVQAINIREQINVHEDRLELTERAG